MDTSTTYVALPEDVLVDTDSREAVRLRLVLEYGEPLGQGLSLRDEVLAIDGACQFADRAQAEEFLRSYGGGYLLDGETHSWIGAAK